MQTAPTLWRINIVCGNVFCNEEGRREVPEDWKLLGPGDSSLREDLQCD